MGYGIEVDPLLVVRNGAAWRLAFDSERVRLTEFTSSALVDGMRELGYDVDVEWARGRLVTWCREGAIELSEGRLVAVWEGA